MENKFNNKGNVNIDKQIDNSNNKGQINISNDKSTINAAQNIDNRVLDSVDISKLVEELNLLKLKLVEKEMYIEADSVKKAIEVDQEIERVGFLKSAGIKVLEISQEICLPVATAVLAKTLGVEI